MSGRTRGPGEERAPEGGPHRYRLLLRAYPSWFRREFGDELVRHLERQRSEDRYGRGWLGGPLFWWDVTVDALKTGLSLRLGTTGEGTGAREIERRARGRKGAVDVWRGHTRGGDGTMLETLLRDARHAIRGLVRSPGYTAVFVVTLGLGIGANTAMFSAVDGVLLRPLPHQNGDRLVYLRQSASREGEDNVLFSVPEIADYREGAPSLEAVAEFSALTFTMLGYGEPRLVRAGIVTGNYFDVMGLSATLGRTIGPEDDGAEAPAVIVLSDAYWRNTLGADPDILGKTVEMNGRTATFVGVAEPAPPYPEQTDIYVNLATSPHHLDASMNYSRTHRMTEAFARLAPGASVERARAEVSAIASRSYAQHPEAYEQGAGYRVSVTPLKTQLTARVRPTLLVALGTALLVLIIACANLANLTLARVLRRDHEMAIRVSLGGSRATLRRELLVESLILAIGGAALGLLMTSLSLGMLVRFAERFTARASEITIDRSVFGFTLLAAVAASAFFTVVPRLPDGEGIGGALARSGTRSTLSSGAKRAQRLLVVAQIATSFVLLTGAGLLLRTMAYLNHVDPGFDTSQVLTMDIPENALLSGSEETRDRYLAILEDVRALPGVEDAALTSSVPLSSTGTFASMIMEYAVEGVDRPEAAPAPRADFRVVSPDYFSTLGIDLLGGREFVSTDVEGTQSVVVINESLAREEFGARDPVGKRIRWIDPMLGGSMTEWRTVVGVASDTRDVGLDKAVIPTLYMPYPQLRMTGSLAVRVSRQPEEVLPSLREAILAHNPNQAIDNVRTIAELSNQVVAPRRLNAVLLTSFALLALTIAAVGIAGVLAFSVGRRTREFGVRGALGAGRRQIWSGVVAEGAALAAVGVLLGILPAVYLTRFVSGLLVGVPSLDVPTFVAVGALLGAVAVCAAWWPAWRAARVSPMEALTAE